MIERTSVINNNKENTSELNLKITSKFIKSLLNVKQLIEQATASKLRTLVCKYVVTGVSDNVPSESMTV